MPKILGRSLRILSIFHWNMSPIGTTLNGSLVNLYLPYWHANVVTYDASYGVLGYDKSSFHLSRFNSEPLLCLDKCHSMLFLCALALLILGSVMQSPGTGKPGPSGFATMTELMYHSGVLSNPIGTIICCSCNLSRSFVNSSCSVYTMCLGGDWYGLCLLWLVTKMCLWNTQYLWTYHYIHCTSPAVI